MIMVMVIISIPFLYSFTVIEQKTENASTGLIEHDQITGEQLYQKNCAACHGLERQGNPPAFPSLVSVNERLDKGQVKELLLTGRKAMPSFAHLSEQEREALAGFLFGEETNVEMLTEVTAEQNGQRLFVANCARCHKATPDDPQPPDQRQWGMQPIVLGGITSRYEPEDFKQILNTGPCYMPSFDFLDENDKADIYAWLGTIEMPAESSSNMAMGCRMRCRNRY